MRKLLLPLLLSVSLSVSFYPKKSEAGIIVGLVAGGYLGKGAWMGAVVGAIGYGIGFTQCDNGLEVELWSVFGIPLIVAGTLLDVNSALPTDQLAESFHQRFPYVDNSEALRNLALETKAKASVLAGDDHQSPVTVRFTRSEVESIFASADLSLSQFEQIASELQ